MRACVGLTSHLSRVFMPLVQDKLGWAPAIPVTLISSIDHLWKSTSEMFDFVMKSF